MLPAYLFKYATKMPQLHKTTISVYNPSLALLSPPTLIQLLFDYIYIQFILIQRRWKLTGNFIFNP